MKKNPRHIGDNHVKTVCEALKIALKGQSIVTYPQTTIKTVYYILELFPNINYVISKFNSQNPDQHKDLTLTLDNNRQVSINLFLIKKGARIQPKNLGAKSFFTKYFLEERTQSEFNVFFEKRYKEFLSVVVEEKIGTHYISGIRDLKRLIIDYYPSFITEINPLRDDFLYALREEAFILLKELYNRRAYGFINAFNNLFMTEDLNLITSYGRTDNDVSIEEFNYQLPPFKEIKVYKIGKNSLGINFGGIALTLRFKFESNPISSIKLATSYATFPTQSENYVKNNLTLDKVAELIEKHQYIESKNSSNAIGKCHEAFTYYHLLKGYPEVTQVDTEECTSLIETYSSSIKGGVLQKLFNSTASITSAITSYLRKKYGDFTIESMELVPGSYISDRLNTGDIQLILRRNGAYFQEDFSLKALAKAGRKVTTKNPGIGTILGPTYFNVGSIDSVVAEVKENYVAGKISRSESLEKIAEELGGKIKMGSQDQLKQGIENLFGKATMAITFYDEGKSIYKEHTEILGEIEVLLKEPTKIQNTLSWNRDKEQISLRVKFSKGETHGWSSIKLTSEYKLKQ
ncbi:hypothetical protein AB5I83_17845 [Mesobacillus sp. LC4]